MAETPEPDPDPTESLRQFWADVDRAVETVQSWPQWKRDSCRPILEPEQHDEDD